MRCLFPAEIPLAHHADMNRTRLFFAAILAVLLSACASTGSQKQVLDTTLFHYASAVRWEGVDVAMEFTDPEWRTAHPLSAVERGRYAQWQVAGYNVKGSEPLGENELAQLVEIRLVNKHTQTERVMDRQIWRWDAVVARWWLRSGIYSLDVH